MRKRVETYLYGRLARRNITNDHEKYLYLISLVASTFAVSMNFFLTLFYLAINMTPMPLFIISLVGFLADTLTFWLVEKGRYLPFGLLITGTVIIHVLATAICLGIHNLIIVYLLVTLMMQIIIPYASTRVRALAIFALWLCMFSLVLIDAHWVPLYDIGYANSVLAMFNIHLAFFGTIIQLTIGNIIWNTILRFNRAELEKSKNDANTDPLTGLFNRRYAGTFFDKLTSGQLEQVWCVAMMDIDDFKVVNDTHGHPVGDEVLMFISDFFRSHLRKTDLLFRWGGEEFLILLKDNDVTTAYRILDNLRAKLASENIETRAGTLNVTVTIGVTYLDIDNVEKSIERSDFLTYKGKNSGKNKVVM